MYWFLGSVVNYYYLGFFYNFDTYVNVSILLTTTETHQVQYSIEALGENYHSGNVSAGNDVVLNLTTTIEVASPDDQNKGIYLTTNSDKVTVIGQSLGVHSSDSYLALPITVLSDMVYVYYGISVPRAFHNANIYSSVLIVGTENNTVMKLTVTQSVNISADYLIPGREYSFVINRLQTIFIRSLEDLSGTKIVTDKPVSVFSGHECGNVPWNVVACSYLIEQIPPTELWGKVYYTTPLGNKTSYTIKILAAYNSTIVHVYCNNVADLYTMDEGEFVNKTVIQLYCAVYSNNKILVIQFSHGGLEDNRFGDPAMILVPSINQYLNKFTFSTIRNPLTSPYSHYINIIVMAQYYQPNLINLIAGGVNMSLDTQQWTPIQDNGITEAYATQINISEGVAEIFHNDATAKLMVIVYGFSANDGYGYIGGILLSAGYIHSYVLDFGDSYLHMHVHLDLYYNNKIVIYSSLKFFFKYFLP